jgi:predicted NBD/HSP70 family sugar kinase
VRAAPSGRWAAASGRPSPGAPRQLREVIAQADAGDAGCRSVVADAGRALGVAGAGACDLLAPQRVVVGRELARAGDLLLDPLRACVRGSAIAASRELPVLAGVLGERAEGRRRAPGLARVASWPRRRPSCRPYVENSRAAPI